MSTLLWEHKNLRKNQSFMEMSMEFLQKSKLAISRTLCL